MTKIEKLMIAVTVVVVVVCVHLSAIAINEVREAGGFSQLIIDAGKEAKRIATEIEKE